MQTFLFYDVETSGLNPAFDQVLTFAGIRTDLGLTEVERQTITIRLRNDIIPSPNAFLVHGLTCDALAHGMDEYSAALKIHRMFNTPGTISLGYNSLGFDDEFLRFMFYRNLLDPYTHQYANGCSRMDILPITVLFRIFSPDSLCWPQIEGKPSLKLDAISRENQFPTSGKAHEALNDVEALVALTHQFSLQTDIWNYCLDFFNKTRDGVRINNIEQKLKIEDHRFRICIMVSASFGPTVNYMVPVIHLGPSVAYKNQSLWLRLDSDDILGMDSKVDIKDTFVIRKRPADGLIVLPALERFWHKLPGDSQQKACENMEKIRHQRFFEFVEFHSQYTYPFIPELDPDAALYQDGFFSFQEKKEINGIHQSIKHMTRTDAKEKRFEKINSPRVRQLADRILVRNFYDAADSRQKREYGVYLDRLRSSRQKDQIIGYKNDIKRNCEKALKELKQTREDLKHPTPDQIDLMAWLETHIKSL